MTRAILDGPGASTLRRELGPVAWCALECLLEQSDDGRTAVASVRAIAADLGVAKNTAHRAVTALAHAGLVEPIQERDTDGRFRRGSYRLQLGGRLTAEPFPTPSRTRQRATTTVTPAQLSLLTPA